MAWNTLSPHWNDVAIIMLIIVLCSCIGSGVSMFGSLHQLTGLSMMGSGLSLVVSILLVGPLSIGLYSLILSYIRQEEMQDSALQTVIKTAMGNYTNCVISYFLMTILIALIAIPTLGIGAIILGCAYAMVPFILRDNPELTPREVLHKSRIMMRGHKWDLFVLVLSFIGWFLVAIITFGIGFLWIGPYLDAAIAHFYEDIKGEN